MKHRCISTGTYNTAEGLQKYTTLKYHVYINQKPGLEAHPIRRTRILITLRTSVPCLCRCSLALYSCQMTVDLESGLMNVDLGSSLIC